MEIFSVTFFESELSAVPRTNLSIRPFIAAHISAASPPPVINISFNAFAFSAAAVYDSGLEESAITKSSENFSISSDISFLPIFQSAFLNLFSYFKGVFS
ncbi:MAG: hypothetical protein BWY84_00518 [Candidatus Aerophobetes bacterium ADurb.Bin490]|nr:MAG: hypothetical protein BWY84_00518 [Candidatus Aerophobetes bacterium ADurb.Bin490]